jgi:hypothetical protein
VWSYFQDAHRLDHPNQQIRCSSPARIADCPASGGRMERPLLVSTDALGG